MTAPSNDNSPSDASTDDHEDSQSNTTRQSAGDGFRNNELAGRSNDEPTPVLTMEMLDELRELWHTALEREGNLASAVADVVWKATAYGTTEDGDVYAYIVPKGCMHRLVGVAQSNGAHVPVAFRNLPEESGD